MFYLTPTTINENGEEVEVWDPNTGFIDLANRRD
jgi:hypothetical protein